MRVVMYVQEDIPGLAEAGSHITLRLTDPEEPVVVTVKFGRESLTTLADHLDSVRALDPLPNRETLALLHRLLGYAIPHDHPLRPRLMD